MSADYTPDKDDGTVEKFDDQIPTQAAIRFLELTRNVDAYYLTDRELDNVLNASTDASHHLGFMTFAGGVFASLGSSLLTTFDDFSSKHPKMAIVITSVCISSLLFSLQQMLSWYKARKSLKSLIVQIKKSHKVEQRLQRPPE